MNDKPEVTEAEMLQHMREDAAKFRDVAESISMNREGVAMVAMQIAKKPLTQGAALALCKIMHDVLTCYADDLDEAAEKAESGEFVAKAVVLHSHEDETKH